VHAVYAMSCPLYRTLRTAIQLTSSFELTGKFAFVFTSYFALSLAITTVVQELPTLGRSRVADIRIWSRDRWPRTTGQ
jgi:hypothetical protein